MSLIRESIERIINPAAGKHVTSISDQVFIYHSMIYHYLATNGYPAAAEVMQGECYETFLSRSFLKENVVSYNDDVIEKSLSGHTLKNGVRIQRTIAPTIGVAASPKFSPKPDPAFEEVKDNLKKAIQDSADESVRRREEQIEMEEKSESEEEVVDEDEEESSSEAKSPQSSSSTVESEAEMVTSNWTRRLWGPNPQQLSTDTIIATPAPSRPSQLPPLVDVQHKPRITSIKSIDFDIPELEKSPSVQSVETPRAPLSPVQPAGTAPKQEAADQKASASQCRIFRAFSFIPCYCSFLLSAVHTLRVRVV
ncbi:unnamed protein product [Heligmosomoides polygyrus]|uniref:LisH domain-containing protein n=1 Tax=Heligmosomoides polygyrus TaxID=6339 RepID=A0A183G8A8_HELPZ|nr:unnamed protein product [Heligmosomoides polygyrus]